MILEMPPKCRECTHRPALSEPAPLVKICALKQPNVTCKMAASSAKRSKFFLVKNKELVQETKETFVEKLDDAKLYDLVNPPQEKLSLHS